MKALLDLLHWRGFSPRVALQLSIRPATEVALVPLFPCVHPHNVLFQITSCVVFPLSGAILIRKVPPEETTTKQVNDRFNLINILTLSI